MGVVVGFQMNDPAAGQGLSDRFRKMPQVCCDSDIPKSCPDPEANRIGRIMRD